MHRRFRFYTIAQSSILLVLLVMAVCLGQRVELASACAWVQESPDAPEWVLLKKTADTPSEKPCELGSHWLYAQVQSLDLLWLLYLPALLLLTACLRSGEPGHRIFTEPIAPSRRQHLVLCVFNE